MISWVDLLFLGLFAGSAYRLWFGTTSPFARCVSIGCLAFLTWGRGAP